MGVMGQRIPVRFLLLPLLLPPCPPLLAQSLLILADYEETRGTRVLPDGVWLRGSIDMVTPAYQPRDPSHTVLYQVIADHLETFLATIDADPTAKGLPGYVKEEFYASLQCGILAHGFVRLGCDTCPHKMLLAFRCKRRGFCPSCAGRRMAQMAAHLVEQVIPWVPTRQWVVSVPIPLRYWMASSKDLTATVHTIIRRAIHQYYVNDAVKRGIDRKTAQAGSVTCVQRFGGSINANVHDHFVFLEGVYVDRTDQGLKPRFVKVEPPGDADVTAVVETISHRVIRKLRQLGYLEAGIDAAVATGYDPLGEDEPELARTMAASVQQRIAFGERAGQKVRRIGSGFGSQGTTTYSLAHNGQGESVLGVFVAPNDVGSPVRVGV
jgi:hypothetical protein